MPAEVFGIEFKLPRNSMLAKLVLIFSYLGFTYSKVNLFTVDSYVGFPEKMGAAVRCSGLRYYLK